MKYDKKDFKKITLTVLAQNYILPLKMSIE